MSDQQNHVCEEQARDYEQKAKRVSDPPVKEKYLTLATRRKVPKSEKTDPPIAAIGLTARPIVPKPCPK
jgi:hypothetical protein